MATKKPTAAQLRARKLFAQRSRAGTLKRSPAKKTARGISLAMVGSAARKKPYYKKLTPKQAGTKIRKALNYALDSVGGGVSIEGALERAGNLFEVPYATLIDAYEKAREPKSRAKNPIRAAIEKTGRVIQHFRYLVQTAPADTGPWKIVAGFIMLADARDYAKALNVAMPGVWIKAIDCE